MIIQFQVAGLVILAVIFVLYWQYGKIVLGNQKIFKNILFTATINIVLDIASVLCIKIYAGENSHILNLVCKLYLISLVALVYLSYKYIIFEMIQFDKKMIKYITVIKIVSYVCSGIILVLPIYNVWGESVYTYGPCTVVTYAYAFFVIVNNYINLFKFRKNIEKRRWIASFAWMLCWISAAIIQCVFSYLLVVGFAMTIGLLFLYVKLENPESYHDRETSVLNNYSLNAYISELTANNIKFSMFIIKLEMDSKEYSNSLEMIIIRRVVDKLRKIEDAIIFKSQEKEFTLLIQDNENNEKMKGIEEKVSAILDNKIVIDGNVYSINASLYEICNTVIDSGNQLDLVRIFVNENREAAKSNTVVMDDEWVQERKRKFDTEQMIYRAIDADRVKVFYQPIYSIEDKSFCSAEALVRIENEDGSIVPPGVFIDVAENNGSIIQLGEIVFEKVCKMIVDKKIEHAGFEYIEVNVSAIQSTKSDFADRYISIMDKTGVNPKMINLEITETAAVRSKERLVENMIKLIKYGVSFSLDDFGTGYSNLNYITELPVKIVKFDKNMTDAYFNSAKARIVMCSAINMIKTIGMEIVVEGVERKEQLEKLEKEKIDFIQGYYFSRPVPEEKFIEKHCSV